MKKEKKNLLSQIITEYKQVQWPTVPEVIQVTIVVLLITLFISLMILIFDISFTSIMTRFSDLIKSIIK
ncbi:MAG: preprotein translocase subunit SecE [Streptobacillus sp.]|jgi:preprotein translocase, secE subunit